MGNNCVFEDWNERQTKGEISDGRVGFGEGKPQVRCDHGQKRISGGLARLVVEFEEPQGEGDNENHREEVEHPQVERGEEIEHFGEDIPP